MGDISYETIKARVGATEIDDVGVFTAIERTRRGPIDAISGPDSPEAESDSWRGPESYSRQGSGRCVVPHLLADEIGVKFFLSEKWGQTFMKRLPMQLNSLIDATKKDIRNLDERRRAAQILSRSLNFSAVPLREQTPEGIKTEKPAAFLKVIDMRATDDRGATGFIWDVPITPERSEAREAQDIKAEPQGK